MVCLCQVRRGHLILTSNSFVGGGVLPRFYRLGSCWDTISEQNWEGERISSGLCEVGQPRVTGVLPRV